LNKDRNETNNEKNSSILLQNSFKIEEIVDKILLKNKDKLNKVQLKEIDIEKFSLKNKKGDSFYYLKKKSNKEIDNILNKDTLSKKIISKARINLGKDPFENEEKIEEFNIKPDEDDSAIKKYKKRIRFGKIHKRVNEEYYAKPTTTGELIESEEFEEVVSNIDNIITNKTAKQTEEDAKIIDEKIKEIPKIDDTNQNKDSAEIKTAELAEKHGFFSKKKISNNKEEINWLSSSTDDLAELKKKYGNNLTISDLNSVKTNEFDKDESKFLDEKIKISPFDKESDDKTIEPPEIVDRIAIRDKCETEALKPIKEHLKDSEKKEIKTSKEGIDVFNFKKSFFRRKKSSGDKAVNLEQKEIKPNKLKSKPLFRVENIPQIFFNESEKKLEEKKIMESSKIVDITTEDYKGEVEALKFAKEHIKDKSMPIIGKESSTEKKVKTDIETLLDAPLTESGSDNEHVFFDEENPSFSGWSPQITENGKKKMILPTSVQSEINSDDLKSVGEDVELPKEVLKTKSVKLSELGFSEKEWEELDFYPLHEPFAYVEILREKESLDKCYFLVEIALTEDEENLLGFIKDTLASVDIDAFELEEKNQDEYLLERLNQVIKEYDIEINDESKNKVYYYMGKTSIGLDKIDPLMKDPNIEDISCDGSGIPIFLYHRKYGSLKSNIRFSDEDELSSFVFKLAQKCGKHISIAEPMLDATMPDGSRIQMTLSDEITAKGSTFTIRKFRSDPFSPPDLIEFNTMSSEMVAYMWIAVENGINTLFAGGTASGKTTALNALSLFIPRESKIVSIEETREINLPHPNWIPGVARSGFGEIVADRMVGEIDMYDLMKAALRQ